MATPDPIACLIRPRHVAVIGASGDPSKTSGRPIAYLQKHGYKGAIYPVNPRSSTIAGLTSYPDIAALPQAPDVAIVLLGPERATDAVRELAARGTIYSPDHTMSTFLGGGATFKADATTWNAKIGIRKTF